MYSHILVAVDAQEDAVPVLRRAQALAQCFNSRLSLLHVMETPAVVDPAAELTPLTPINVGEQMEELARKRLNTMCAELGLPENCAEVAFGPRVGTILRAAEQQKAELVVIGHHPRRGLLSWFSHTDDALVHRARCDVLAVVIGEEPK
jgi:universal stress protein A